MEYIAAIALFISFILFVVDRDHEPILTKAKDESFESLKVFVIVLTAPLWFLFSLVAMFFNFLFGDRKLAGEIKQSLKKKHQKHLKEKDWLYQKLDRRVENLIAEQAKVERRIAQCEKHQKANAKEIQKLLDFQQKHETAEDIKLQELRIQSNKIQNRWNSLQNKVKELDQKTDKLFIDWNELRPELALKKEDISLEEFQKEYLDKRGEVVPIKKSLTNWGLFFVLMAGFSFLPANIMSILFAGILVLRLPQISRYYAVKFNPTYYAFLFIFLLINFFLMPTLGLGYVYIFIAWFFIFLFGMGKSRQRAIELGLKSYQIGMKEFFSCMFFLTISIQSFQYLSLIGEVGGHSFQLLFIFLVGCFYSLEFFQWATKPFFKNPKRDLILMCYLPAAIITAVGLHLVFHLDSSQIAVLIFATHAINYIFRYIGLPEIAILRHEYLPREQLIFGPKGMLDKVDHLLVELPLFCLGYYWLL